MEETSCIKQAIGQIEDSMIALKRIVEEPDIEQLKRIVSDLTRVRELQEAEIQKLRNLVSELREDLLEINAASIWGEPGSRESLIKEMEYIFDYSKKSIDKCGCTVRGDESSV